MSKRKDPFGFSDKRHAATCLCCGKSRLDFATSLTPGPNGERFTGCFPCCAKFEKAPAAKQTEMLAAVSESQNKRSKV